MWAVEAREPHMMLLQCDGCEQLIEPRSACKCNAILATQLGKMYDVAIEGLVIGQKVLKVEVESESRASHSRASLCCLVGFEGDKPIEVWPCNVMKRAGTS